MADRSHARLTKNPAYRPVTEKALETGLFLCVLFTVTRRSDRRIEYSLTRSADDLESTPYYGKGAAFCYRERPDILYRSMGRA